MLPIEVQDFIDNLFTATHRAQIACTCREFQRWMQRPTKSSELMSEVSVAGPFRSPNGTHTTLICSNGKAYIAQTYHHGTIPRLVPGLSTVFVTKIDTTSEYALLLTNTGSLYEVASYTYTSASTFRAARVVDSMKDHVVVQIACGTDRSVLLTTYQTAYSLMHNLIVPSEVQLIQGGVTSIDAAGKMIALSDTDGKVKSLRFINSDVWIGTPEAFEGIVSVFTSGNYTLCINHKGEVWGVGCGTQGQLGTGERKYYRRPVRMVGIPAACTVECINATFSVITTHDKRKYYCGELFAPYPQVLVPTLIDESIIGISKTGGCFWKSGGICALGVWSSVLSHNQIVDYKH
jgi:alpha-tubulin suppressor-like RCC1 family protein